MTNVQAPVAPRRFTQEPQPVALPLHPALTADVSIIDKAATLRHYTRMAAEASDVPRLLALVMDGNNAQIVSAAKRLRELFLASEAAAVAERAAELMKGPA